MSTQKLKEYRRRYYLKHREKALKQGRDWYKRNRSRKLEVCKRWRTNNPDRQRKSQARRLYGITYEDYDSMLKKQNGLCKLCQEFMKKPVIEHDHKNNKIRGFTCQRCNIIIGMVESARDLGLLPALNNYLSLKETNEL
jgi:hypothetical protein